MNKRKQRWERRLRRRDEERESENQTMLLSTVTVFSFASFLVCIARIGFKVDGAVYSLGIGLAVLAFGLLCYGMLVAWAALTTIDRSLIPVVALGFLTIVIPFAMLTHVGEFMDAGLEVTPSAENPLRMKTPEVDGAIAPFGDQAYLLIREDFANLGKSPDCVLYEQDESDCGKQIDQPDALPDALVQIEQSLAQEAQLLGQPFERVVTVAIDRDAPFHLLQSHLQHVDSGWVTKILVLSSLEYGTMHVPRLVESDAQNPHLIHVTHEGVSLDEHAVDTSGLKEFSVSYQSPSGGYPVRVDDDVPVQKVVDVFRILQEPDAHSVPQLEIRVIPPSELN